MNDREYKSTFIPCGDSLEKMDAIRGGKSEGASGDITVDSENDKACPACGASALEAEDGFAADKK